MQFRLKRSTTRPAIVLWLLVLVSYSITWRAGFVTDAVDWLYDAENLPLGAYLNRSHSTIHALYQFTQLVTLGLYKLFGTARLPWFLLFTTMHAGAAFLLYLLCGNLFKDASLRRPRRIAFWGAVLFCISPYCSEVVVWKACFHYLQGILLILGVLRCVQDFIYNPRPAMPWIAGFLFGAGALSLELFYLTPLLTVLLLLYYGRLGWNTTIVGNAWKHFLIPQAAILALHFAIFYFTYGEWASHGTGGAFAMPVAEHLTKGVRYGFHLLLFGRFWPQSLKESVYELCKNPLIIILFYASLLAAGTWLFLRAKKGYGREQVGVMLLAWTVLAVLPALMMPLEPLFDLAGNRYLYLPVAFGSMLAAVMVDALPKPSYKIALASVVFAVAGFLILRTNRHWQTSERINSSLLQHIPAAPGKTTVLLAMPYCYKGVPMINAWPSGNFSRMHDALYQPPLDHKVRDGMAFNVMSPGDGAVAERVNDSTYKVTLNQWGTWWWYQDFGGHSYENADYRVVMRDVGHWYELVLKRPADQYQLLCMVGDKWQLVQ